MNYEKLRNMESFTQQMFQNIIDFQEKQHPAWNSQLDFAERIAQLPLHYLVFSAGDRDPQQFGPTVNHFFPMRWEMARLAATIRQLGTDPAVLDIHPRNGFIGSLLGREGVKVKGLTNTEDKPNQISSFYDADVFQFVEHMENQTADVLLCNWPDAGTDDSALIVAHNPKLVIYFFTDHVNEESGLRQTGVQQAFGEKLQDDFELIDEWQVDRPRDMFHEIWPDLTPNIEETRTVRVMARKNLKLQAVEINQIQPHYPWEDELEMVLLALQAKQEILARGLPVEM